MTKLSFFLWFLLFITACVEQKDITDVKESKKILTSSQQSSVNDVLNRVRQNSETKNFHTVVDYPFLITGNLSKEQLAHWQSRIKRTRTALRRQLFEKDPKKLIQIWLFDSAESYYDFNYKLWGTRPISPYGYYIPSKNLMAMNIATGGGTLTHELVHPYVEANFPKSPLWFNEGLGTLYERSSYPRGGIKGLVNWRLQGLKAAIKAGTMPSLESMMRTSDEQFYGVNTEVHYAQARYLMYYLQSIGLLTEYYSLFKKNINTDPTGVNTLVSLLGVTDIAELEGRWIKFLRSL